MFQRIRDMWKVFKALWKAKKMGMTDEEARKYAFESALGFASDDEPFDLILIPDEARDYFENEASSYLWDDEASNKFELTDKHIHILRQLKLSWNDLETGAPYLDPTEPLTTQPLSILGSEFDEEDTKQQSKRYVELVWALNHFFKKVSIEPGDYLIDENTFADIQSVMFDYDDITDIGLTADGKIRLEAENIKVLKRTLWVWDESSMNDDYGWPVAAIDCKRPYGDMTYWYPEMAGLLDLKMQTNADGFFETTPEQNDYLSAIHLKQLSAAIAILKYGHVDLKG